MDESLKRRLVGATVIMSLIVIFVPMLVDEEPVEPEQPIESNVPDAPPESDAQRRFQSEQVVPLKPQDVAAVPPRNDLPKESGPVASAAPEPVPQAPVASVPEPPAVEAPAAKPPPPPQSLVDDPEDDPGDLQAWVVQVASFTNPKFADSLVEDLRQRKFAAFKEDIHSGGRIWYRVVVGPEVDKQRTRQLQEAIVKSTGDERLRGAIKTYP